MAGRDLAASGMHVTPEEVQRTVRMGFVTRAGVPYHEELAGSNGMSFVLIAVPGTTDEQLEASVQQLRADRDVVGPIRVTRTLGKGMVELVQLWARLGDIPTFPEGEWVDGIEEPFLHFEVGTHREEIWRWFEEQNYRFQVGPMTHGAYWHPTDRQNLKDAVAGICDALAKEGKPLPVTLADAREALKGMVSEDPRVQRQHKVWDEILEAVDSGRGFKVERESSVAP